MTRRTTRKRKRHETDPFARRRRVSTSRRDNVRMDDLFRRETTSWGVA